MITVRRVTKTFGRIPALVDVDLEIGRGECLAIAGPKASGRTTLLRMLATLVPPTSGRITIDGVDIATDPFCVRRLVAYAGGERIDGNGLRVDEYLKFVASARKRPSASVEPAAAVVGLDARALIDTLAVDVQPRLALAAALVAAPNVLLLDEPFRALEAAAHAGFVRWLGRARDAGATIVMSASAVDDVSRVCQRVAHLEAGRVVELSFTSGSLAGLPAELVGA